MAIPAPLPDPFSQGGRFGRTSGRFGADRWPISSESALIGLITYFIRYDLPENSIWLIIFFIKIGLGYIVYRLYISSSKKVAALGISLIIVLMIATYVVFYLSRDTLSPIVGGYSSVLLSANSFFLFRYWRYPAITETRLERSGWYKKIILITVLIFVAWATIELIAGVESGLRQTGVALFWIGFHTSTGILMKTKVISQ